jgi:hypothetical protein
LRGDRSTATASIRMARVASRLGGFTMWLVWLIAVAVIGVIIAVIILGVRGGKDLRRKP